MKAEEYDFFEGRDDEPRSRRDRRQSRAQSRAQSRQQRARASAAPQSQSEIPPVPMPPGTRIGRAHEATYRVGDRPGKVSRRVALAALLAGLVAVALAGLSAAHELAPAYLDPDGKVSGRLIAIAGAALIAVTLVLVIVARATTPRRVSRRGVASGGIITFVLAVLLLALGVVVGVLFPLGLIRPAVRDEAPSGSADGMKFGIERVVGTCTSGWTDLNVGGYPGVDSAAVCTDTRVAYITFDSDIVADSYNGAVTAKITELLDEHADDARAQGDWRTLGTGRWLAFGSKENMTALQREWGGTLATVESDGTSGGTATSTSGSEAKSS
ncbi:hypothetical protein [Bifidobacterium parmae]|uniref:Uncharacterized protein n=1 Tax=Bifidobacterium parmae TaxID=361854 RepID=A0A2N5J3W4_9BIFI|nr:hypothetical protein [Bifidobacterium parmae]PLS28896.1 hypothetical protein Uis4E_1039 [Bifidobacterium parmae]